MKYLIIFCLIVFTISYSQEKLEAKPILTSSISDVNAAWKGSEGAGDSYFPQAGNGGYDVSHYNLALHYVPETRELKGTTIIHARATQPLRSFNLDFDGTNLSVDNLKFDDQNQNANYDTQERELVINLFNTIEKDSTFKVEIEYHGIPTTINSTSFYFPLGWHETPDGATVISGSDGAFTWYPVNNHPKDKATYHFQVTVPTHLQVAANGEFLKTIPNDDNTHTWIWEMRQEMASYLANITIGELEQWKDVSSSGVPISNFAPPHLLEPAKEVFSSLPEMIDYFETLFGDYPFNSYGHIVVNKDFPGALETQGRSIFSPDLIVASDSTIKSDTISNFSAHELAHQWFGNAVSLENWQDIWLTEGWGTYAEALWQDHIDPEFDINKHYQEISEAGNYAPIGDPQVENLFANHIYKRGALTLHALRLELGDEKFFELAQTWIKTHKYKNASAQEFMDLAEEVSQKQLDSFFQAWLHDEQMPSLEISLADLN